MTEEQQVHPAAVAQEFMKRTDMKGGEVQAYAETFNWLQGFIENEIIATPAEAHHAMIAELTELRDYRRENDAAYEKKAVEGAGATELEVVDSYPDDPETGDTTA